MDADRVMAWGRLEFCIVGAVIFCDPHDREEQLRKAAGADKSARPALYAGDYSNNMGCVCCYRYRAAGGLSGQYVRYTADGCYGWHSTVTALPAGIWFFAGGLYFVRHSFSHQMV